MPVEQEVKRAHRKLLATYIYTNERGDPVFEIVRYEPKDFRVRIPLGNGTYDWKRPATIYPYKCHEIFLATENEIVFICEGEKDVETLRSHRLIATTNPFGQGPGKFHPEWAKYFKGKHVMLIPDADQVGREHMERIGKLLLPEVKSLATLELPLEEGQKDVTDWFSAINNTLQGFIGLAIDAQQNAKKKPIKQLYEEFAEEERGDAYEGERPAAQVARHQEEEEESQTLPFQPFPILSLPKVLQAFVISASKALCCDPTYFALPSLVSLGGLIGNSRSIQLKSTWIEPCVFWGVVIADSSTLKSPAQVRAVLPSRMIQDELFKDYEKAMDVWRDEMERWKSSGGKKEGSKEYASKPSPKRPNPARTLVSDITIEKLAEVVYQNPRGLTLCMDELSGWFQGFSQYKGTGGGSDRSIWLEIFGAPWKTIDRKGGDTPTMNIPRFAVSVLGTIQPSIFAKTMSDDVFDCGLTARLLFSMPPKIKKVWTDDVIPEDIWEAYQYLYQLIWTVTQEEKTEGKPWPKIIHFDKSGKEAWIDFYNRHADKQHVSDGRRAAALAKLEAYCARFALLLCEIDYFSGEVKQEVITGDHVVRASRLILWFQNEADRVYSMICQPSMEADESKLLDLIKRKGGEISPRDLQRSNANKYTTAKIALAVLEGLVARNLGTWELKAPNSANGEGHHSKIFVLNEG